MGKSQTKKKTRGERHNPMRVPDTHLGGGKGEGKADPAKEKEMLPIFTKLKSAEYADRTWACAAICNLIQNDPATRRLFQANNIVGALLERLSDSVDEVVVEASGALRNLAIDGGHEMCAEMFNKGIMSHLTVLIAKITSTIDSIVLPASANADKSSDADFQARKHLLGLTENVIALIWCLAEANHKTLAAVNAAQVQGLLLRAVTGREVLGQGVALAAAHALYSLSQDNYPFTRSILATPAVLPELVNVVQKEHTMAESGKKKGKCKAKDQDDGRALLTRVLVAGALRNFVLPGSKADELVDIVALTNSTILPLVNSLLDIDVSSTVSQVMELVAHAPSQDVANLAKGMNTDHRSDAEVALERIERKLTTVSVGLEILTGICAGLEDVQVDDATAEETAPADDDEEMEDDDAELADDALIDMARDSAVEDTKTVAPTVNTAVTLQYLLATLQLPQRLTSLSLLNNLSFPPTTASPSPHAPTTSALSVLHLRALEALNNLLLTVVASIPPEDAASRSQVGNVIPVKGVWDGVFSIVTLIRSEPQALDMKGQELRRDVMEMALGCIWGLAKIAPEAVGVTTEQEQLLIDTLGSLRGENSRTQCVETIAALASRQNVPLEENKVIGTWLVSQLSPSVTFPTDTLMAVINALIDIYADESREYDQVFVQGGFLQSLTSCVARVKGEVRKIDRRKNLALRAVAEEVYENLAAFVKYRRGLARS